MPRYFIGIGSNDEASDNCRQMIRALESRFDGVRVSQLVKTRAHGVDGPDYMNAVACFESPILPEDLAQWCKQIEKALGRDRSQSLCRADLDILLVQDRPEGGETGPVNLDAVHEPWFRPLMAELLESA